MQAMAWNCRNQSLRCQGRSPSGDNREASVPMRRTGADRFVVARRPAMGLEQRNRVRWSCDCHNWRQEEGDVYDRQAVQYR